MNTGQSKLYTIPDDIVLNTLPLDDNFKQNGELYTDYYSIRSDLPAVVDMRSDWGQCYWQGNIGSCTANACVGAIRFLTRRMGMEVFEGSRLFNYYCARALWWDVNRDTGAHSSGAFLALQCFGLCKESTWPYDTSKFTNKPPPEAYQEADLKDVQYLHLDPGNLQALKQCLADGYPIVFCLKLGSNWTARDGYVPDPVDDGSIGSHCMVCCGFDDTKQMFIVANSWGHEWGGMQGFLYISYKYVQSGWDFVSPRLFGKQTIPAPLSGRTDTVSIFSQYDYLDQQLELPVGEYPNIAAAGMKLNDAGSIRLPEGYHLELFTGTNFTGKSLLVTKNTRWLGWRNDSSFNDTMQSAKIYKLVPDTTVKFANSCTDIYSNTDNKITPQNSIKSPNGMYTLQIRNTGEIVILDNKNVTVFTTKPINIKADAYRLSCQPDGNLVVYSPTGAVWASNTNGKGKAPYILKLSDAGIASVDSATGITWQTPTPTPQPQPTPQPTPTPTPQPTPTPTPQPTPVPDPGVPALGNDSFGISRNRAIQFGTGYSREMNAGQIAYGKFDGGENGTLNIIGGGKTDSTRIVTMWDHLKITKSLTVNNRNLLSEIDELKTRLSNLENKK